ncbi:MAG: GGDEF domain-containing protein [Candidatus Micrarchaeota archaeon]|nr:GGDEF domain-containing protein [Candidatus Micrarchaeota archaeon]
MEGRRNIKKDRQIQGLRQLARRSTDRDPDTTAELLRLRMAYKRLSRDARTGLHVAGEGERELRKLVKSAIDGKTDISVVFFDINRFKELNDTFGHDAGNDALARLGNVISGLVRDTDIAYRYGGDEIVVGLPNASNADAAAFIRRVSKDVQAVEADLRNAYGIPEFSISAGSRSANGAEIRDVDEGMLMLTKGADSEMYENKRTARG